MKADILGNEVEIGDTVRFMQIKYRGFMDGTIVSMADTSALISHEPTNTCRTKSRQCYDQMISLSALDRNRRAQPSEKPEPLTLGELRQMGGEPIWIKEFPPYAFAGYKVLSLRVVDVYGDIVCEDGDIYEYERYGKTWLAYRTKPEGSEG